MYLLSSTVNAGDVLGDAGMTMLIGMAVVFAVLLLLTGVFKLFGVVASATESKEQTSSATPVAPAAVPAAAPIVGNTEQVQSSMELDNEIAPETVAVISAAVASVAPAGTQYAVSAIKKL